MTSMASQSKGSSTGKGARPRPVRDVSLSMPREEAVSLGQALSNELRYNVLNERTTDAVVYSKEGTYLNLHKAILLSCPKLKSAILPNLCCKGACLSNQNIEVSLIFPDYEERILKKAFEFIYTGNLSCRLEDKAKTSEFLTRILGLPDHLPTRGTAEAGTPPRYRCWVYEGCIESFEAENLYQHLEGHIVEMVEMAKENVNERCFHCGTCKEFVNIEGGRTDITSHFNWHRKKLRSMIKAKTGYTVPSLPTEPRQAPSTSAASAKRDPAKLVIPPPSRSRSAMPAPQPGSPKVSPLKLRVNPTPTSQTELATTSTYQVDSQATNRKRSARELSTSLTTDAKQKHRVKRRASSQSGQKDSSDEEERTDSVSKDKKKKKKKKKKRKREHLSKELFASGSQSDDESDGPAEHASRTVSPPSQMAKRTSSREAPGPRSMPMPGRKCSLCKLNVLWDKLTLHAAWHHLSWWADERAPCVDGRFACTLSNCNSTFDTRDDFVIHLAVDHDQFAAKLREKDASLEDFFDPVVKDIGKKHLRVAISDTSDDEPVPQQGSVINPSSAEKDPTARKDHSSDEIIDPNAMTDTETM